MDALDRRGGRRHRRKTEVKYQFSCLKWSMKWYFASAQLRTPAKVPLVGSYPCYTWYWHQALSHTQKHIIATSLFERDRRNSETPHILKKKSIKQGKNTSPFSKSFPPKGQENDPQYQFAEESKGWRCFRVPKTAVRQQVKLYCHLVSLLRPHSNHSSSFLAEARWSVSLFQCLLVPPITLRFRTWPSLSYTHYTSSRELLHQIRYVQPVVHPPPSPWTTWHQN